MNIAVVCSLATIAITLITHIAVFSYKQGKNEQRLLELERHQSKQEDIYLRLNNIEKDIVEIKTILKTKSFAPSNAEASPNM